MKKLFFMTVAMCLLTSAVYAQLTFGGYFNSGLGLTMVGDNDPQIKAFGVDSDSNGYRLRLNGSYQNEARTAGFRLRLQSQRTITPSTSSAADHTHSINGIFLSIPFAYGFMNFFDNKLSVLGGIVDDGAWQTADWWFNEDLGEGLGALLKVNPIDGLVFGAGIYINSQLGGGANNVLALPINQIINIGDAKYVFSASYTMKDTFYLGGSFRTENAAGGATRFQESMAVMGDLRILAVSPLTAVVAFEINNLQDFANTGTMIFSETFAFKITDDLTLGLNAVQFIYQNDNDPGFLFNLWGSYAFGNIIPRLDLVYFINGHSNDARTAAANPQYHRRGYAARSDAAEHSVFSARPSVRINLDNRTHLEIGNVTHIDFAAAAQSFWGNKDSRLSNIFYIDLRWSF